MDAAAKTAQAEARLKNKVTAKKESPKPETTTPADTSRQAQLVKEEPSRTASLFDAPGSSATTATESDEDEEILADAADDEPVDEIDDLDEAA